MDKNSIIISTDIVHQFTAPTCINAESQEIKFTQRFISSMISP